MTQARVQGGGAQGAGPPPPTKKLKKKVIRANFKLFHIYFCTFLVENVILSAIFWAGPPLEILKSKKKKKIFQISGPPLRILGTHHCDSVQNCLSSQCCQLDTIIDKLYVVDQSKQSAQIYLQKNACCLKLQLLLILFFVKTTISDMHHRITYMYINFHQNWVCRSVIPCTLIYIYIYIASA